MAYEGENPSFQNIRPKETGTTAPASPPAGMIYYNTGTSTTAEGMQIYREGSSTKFPPYSGTDGWATLLDAQSAGEDINLNNIKNISASGGGTYAATEANASYLITATAGTLTVTLPTASPANRWIIIKDKGGTSNVSTGLWTIDPNGSETIDGVSTKTISVAYGLLHLISDGTNWQSVNVLPLPTDASLQVREKTTPAGSYTWTAPDSTTGTDVRWAFVQLLGGGGGGGGARTGNVEIAGGAGGAGGCYWEEFIYFEPGDVFTIIVAAGGTGGGSGSGAGTSGGGAKGSTTSMTCTAAARHIVVKSPGGNGGGGGSGVAYTNYDVIYGGAVESINDAFILQCSNIYYLKNVSGGNTRAYPLFTADNGASGVLTGATGGVKGSPEQAYSGSDWAVAGGGGAGGFLAAGGAGGGSSSMSGGAGGGGGGWSTAGTAGSTGGSGGNGGAGGIRITFLGQVGTGNII